MEQQTNELIRQLSHPLAQGKGWMKFVAVLTIVYGILLGLSIIGLLIAWLPIWLGVVLLQAATSIEEAEFTGEQLPLLKAMARLRSYFTIMGVLALIGLLIFGGVILLGFAGAMMGGMDMHSLH